MNKYLIAGLTAFCCAMPTAQADDIVDATPLVRDFVANNPGLEIAVPYIRYNDNVEPIGFPESVTFWFNVYPVGSAATAKLYNTLPKTVLVPAFPCGSNYTNVEDDMKVKFMGANTTSRVHLVVTASIGCWDLDASEWKESYKTAIYSANAAASDSSWLKAWNLNTVAANGMDITADGTNELMLTMEVPTALGNALAKVVFLNGADGTVIEDDAYPLSNSY